MNILIVEDELLIAEMLKAMLVDLGHDQIEIAKNYAEAISHLDQALRIDLCFLDINLQSEKSGFDVAQFIRDHYSIPLLFLTSYSDKQTIQQAMAFKPEAYLIKPFSELDVFTTLEVFQHRTQWETKSQALIIKDGSKSIKLKSEDVIYIKSDNIYVEIKTTSKSYLIRNSLSKFLEEMNVSFFQRIHRTYAINLMHLQAISGEFALVGNEKLPISRLHKEELLDKFKR